MVNLYKIYTKLAVNEIFISSQNDFRITIIIMIAIKKVKRNSNFLVSVKTTTTAYKVDALAGIEQHFRILLNEKSEK